MDICISRTQVVEVVLKFELELPFYSMEQIFETIERIENAGKEEAKKFGLQEDSEEYKMYSHNVSTVWVSPAGLVLANVEVYIVFPKNAEKQRMRIIA